MSLKPFDHSTHPTPVLTSTLKEEAAATLGVGGGGGSGGGGGCGSRCDLLVGLRSVWGLTDIACHFTTRTFHLNTNRPLGAFWSGAPALKHLTE